MHTRHYRLTVLGCALSWLLVGLHLPTLHQLTREGHEPHRHVLALTALFILLALAGTWRLLRVRAS